MNTRIPASVLFCLIVYLPGPLVGAEVEASGLTLEQVVQLLQKQQQDIDRQNQQLQSQSAQISRLQGELASLRGQHKGASPGRMEGDDPITEVVVPGAPLVGPAENKSDAELQAETQDRVAAAQVDDPTQDLLNDLPGAWRLPGTDAAFRIGGFVKNLDGLQRRPIGYSGPLYCGFHSGEIRDGGRRQSAK